MHVLGPCNWAQALEQSGFLQPEPILHQTCSRCARGSISLSNPYLTPFFGIRTSRSSGRLLLCAGIRVVPPCSRVGSANYSSPPPEPCAAGVIWLFGLFFFLCFFPLCLLVGGGNLRMRGLQRELQDCAQLWVPYFSSILFNVAYRMGFWVFFSCVSFLPPDLRRGTKCRLPLCTWFKTALWRNWQDGDVAHTREMAGICKGGHLCVGHTERGRKHHVALR